MQPTLTTPSMRYWRMAPDPRLRPHVLCYFLALPTGGALSAACAARPEALQESELLLPDGHSEIVFQLDGAFERWQLGEAARPRVMQSSYVIGSRSHTVLTRDLGPVTVAGIKLDPRALRGLLGTPLTELRESTVPLGELGQRGLLEVEDALASVVFARDERAVDVSARDVSARDVSARDVSARDVSAGDVSARNLCAHEVAGVLDRYLLRALPPRPHADAAIAQLLAQIRASRGSLPIMEWIRERRVDPRHLERRFADAIGMTPKRYARIVRFKHGYHALLANAAELAASRPPPATPHGYLDGFYDQSHFNREFRAFIGAPPTARLKATLREATNISDHLLAGELSSAL